MRAKFVGLELAGVRVHGVERGERQRHIDDESRRFCNSRSCMSIADWIETFVANVGYDVDDVVHRVDVSLCSDFDLSRCAADNIAEHLSPDRKSTRLNSSHSQ